MATSRAALFCALLALCAAEGHATDDDLDYDCEEAAVRSVSLLQHGHQLQPQLSSSRLHQAGIVQLLPEDKDKDGDVASVLDKDSQADAESVPGFPTSRGLATDKDKDDALVLIGTDEGKDDALVDPRHQQEMAKQMVCPGSSGWVHASCKVEALAKASCEAVAEEMRSRVSGQPDKWHDPLNNGMYKIVGTSGSEFTRQTKDGEYKMVVTLVDAGPTACTVLGCSESPFSSLKDYSANYCNLRMLYCGSEDGCKPVVNDFDALEIDVRPSILTTASKEDCLTA